MFRFQNFIKTSFSLPYNTKKNSKHPKAHLVFQSYKHIVWEKILYDMQRKDDRKNPYTGCQSQQRGTKGVMSFACRRK